MCTMWVSEKWLHRFSAKLVAATLAVVGLLVFCAVNFTSCIDPTSAEGVEINKQDTQVRADYFINGMTYVKDPRTGKCYAITAVMYPTALFTGVSCDNIPPELLTTARIKPGSTAPAEAM